MCLHRKVAFALLPFGNVRRWFRCVRGNAAAAAREVRRHLGTRIEHRNKQRDRACRDADGSACRRQRRRWRQRHAAAETEMKMPPIIKSAPAATRCGRRHRRSTGHLAIDGALGTPPRMRRPSGASGHRDCRPADLTARASRSRRRDTVGNLLAKPAHRYPWQNERSIAGWREVSIYDRSRVEDVYQPDYRSLTMIPDKVALFMFDGKQRKAKHRATWRSRADHPRPAATLSSSLINSAPCFVSVDRGSPVPDRACRPNTLWMSNFSPGPVCGE
jgi:hypothetical protein